MLIYLRKITSNDTKKQIETTSEAYEVFFGGNLTDPNGVIVSIKNNAGRRNNFKISRAAGNANSYRFSSNKGDPTLASFIENSSANGFQANDILKIEKKGQEFTLFLVEQNDDEYETLESMLINKQNTVVITEDIIQEDYAVDEDDRNREATGENILLYGVPGSGKSWTISEDYCDDESCMERLVFHPDYMYSDFVGQILPIVKKGKGDDTEKVRYEFTPGPFTKILKNAYKNPSKSFYLIIEEINRGNAPAIFGEIFQLLDRMPTDKIKDNKVIFRECTSEYGITNASIAKEVYGNEDRKIRIPSNLSIIGTMNTSDQNVFTLDTAFQRRWIMRMIPNSFEGHKFGDKAILDTGISWKQFCEAINEEILRRNNVTSSEDKRLGAYFITASDLELEEIPENIKQKEQKRIEHKNARFAEKVLKYLWDDAFKFSHAETFDTKKYKSLEDVIKGFMTFKEKARFNVFHENLRKLIIEGVEKTDNIVLDNSDDLEQ